MPHERGPLPVPPSEFSCSVLADPKARFCRSLANHSLTVNGRSACRLSKPLTLRHLTTTRTSPPEGLALPRLADAYVPIHNFQDAPSKSAPAPK